MPTPNVMPHRRPVAPARQVALVYTSDVFHDAQRRERREAARVRKAQRIDQAIEALRPEGGWFCCADCDVDPDVLDRIYDTV